VSDLDGVSILPDPPEPAGESLPQIAFLQRFLEITNEIERAIRETEIYPVRCVRHWVEGVHEYLIVQERNQSVALANGRCVVMEARHAMVGPEEESN
jgi:hypothetical protein